ncbi:LysR family transcriptional regulator [Rhizobium sp. RM]|uniref:LysR family transcriptional regulator n=1 Tax=Rhizobium sp. RM TaxID=2748079 RepID=UPI0015B784CD|nr:LysR family transcriptional regulator [Rhizobium sp. RM]NWJ25436.1 LysR family transcriptional regulator [Rhizobium sp. RM]
MAKTGSLSAQLLNRMLVKLRLRHFQAIVNLCDLKQLGRAAEAMHISQPAMSQLLADLENLLEAKLFVRHAKGVDPTALTLEIVGTARLIVKATEDGAERIASHLHSDASMIRIASTVAGTGAILSKLVPVFSEQNPDISLQVTSVIGDTLTASFASGLFDLVCMREGNPVGDGWRFSLMVPDRLIVIAGAHHPLVGSKHITGNDLAECTWLTSQIASLARERFEAASHRWGWTQAKQIRVMHRGVSMLPFMLNKTDAVYALPLSVATPLLDCGAVKQIPFDLGIDVPGLGCAWLPARQTTATARFLDAAISEFGVSL